MKTIDKGIRIFFDERKEAWLKKNIKPSTSEEDKQQLERQCDELFSAQQWLPNAAKRAGQISIATHPCTFSHPSSRKNKNGYASSIIAASKQTNDGFLRSGNVAVAADALGNAAALDVYKFLMVELEDGQSLLQHLQQDSAPARTALAIKDPGQDQDYKSLKQGFLAMTASSDEAVSSSKIKQVYFPIKTAGSQELEYHQLSILTPSAIVYELRERLDSLRFGDTIKSLRENKKNNRQGEGYKEIYDLTTIGYGGTKPQNISVLNNKNGGKAHLLMSMPPQLAQRDIHFPSRDFFSQSLYFGKCRKIFYELHELYQQPNNNIDIRNQRDSYYRDIVNYIIEIAWQMRSISNEQYSSERSQLPKSQRIWLHSEPANGESWLDDILKNCSLFIFAGYEKSLGQKAIKLGHEELLNIRKIVDGCQELLL